MINNRGMARAGATMVASGTVALLAPTGCSWSGSRSAAALFSSGPAHTISTPTRLGSYTRNPSLEKAMDVNGLKEQMTKTSSERASGILSAVYAQGNVTPGGGGSQQVFMFVGGHLPNDDPASSIASFRQAYPRAQMVSAGSLGGEAACASTTSNQGSVAMCAWFDNDTFGTLVSPTMSAAKLANTLETVRPGIERVGQ